MAATTAVRGAVVSEVEGAAGAVAEAPAADLVPADSVAVVAGRAA